MVVSIWRVYLMNPCVASGFELPGLSPTRTIRLAARILHLMNRSGDKGEKLRRLVAELVHHNDERSQSQRDFFMSAASVVARLLVEGCGKRALSWPSASDHGFAGLVHAAYDLLGKLACNVSLVIRVEYPQDFLGVVRPA